MSDAGKSKSKSSRDFIESDFKAYSFKIIKRLCERHRKALKVGDSTDFNINEIWIEDFQAMFDINYFLLMLYKIREDVGYIEIHRDVVRLTEGKKNICAEVGILLE